MVSRVLFSSQLTFPAKPPRETPIAPLTPPRNVLSFSFRSSVDRFAMRIVKAASFTRTVAKVGGSRDEEAISRKKLAVFVSGGGSNFKKIHEGCIGGSVQGDLVLLVTNKKDCGGAEYARSNGIAVLVFPKPKRESSDGLSPTELVDVLREYGVDFVLLAGYLKLIPAELVKAFPKRILNIHPALLPAFGGKGLYGIRVHKAVLASGARYSGPTIHFVDEEYDTGRILAQSAVRVVANDTPEELAKRVLHEEHKLYVEVVAAICEERIKWREDGVPLIQSKDNPDDYY
ncbi:PREDICTED: phosphoribosylglycinamide formyltransferase, chloroplastic isoform X1 [Brassica oleracea var. oleracea]|uniref:Phosphoribosylglycinamide formyltransferase, chloroplastic n=1 Tax=Brassica oleracea var. oleracea TaxID=109376 RepID=A0A0D3CF47_BRAOL|nr:PREDICTED: phosphoribosylglycinamide formyltransferase, chloroplastic isoform X1 [Brassica oleracea var. oleracea]